MGAREWLNKHGGNRVIQLQVFNEGRDAGSVTALIVDESDRIAVVTQAAGQRYSYESEPVILDAGMVVSFVPYPEGVGRVKNKLSGSVASPP